MTEPILEVRNASVSYRASARGGRTGDSLVRAVSEVSLTVQRGQTLGVVGESGSGKTTLGRAILRRVELDAGEIVFDGRDITTLYGKALRQMRSRMQMVFQDPYGSLNSRMRVGDLIAEPLIVHKALPTKVEVRQRVLELLDLVGLPADAADRFPRSFSGGQRQRVGIARALALNPELLVIDEPVAALDTSVQAQVINLLEDLQKSLGLAYLFIAHDLSVVRHVSDDIVIMHAGRIVERGPAADIFDNPMHPYTQALLSAVPRIKPKGAQRSQRILLRVSSSPAPDAGCPFFERCPRRQPTRCETEFPELRPVENQVVSCHWAEDFVRQELPTVAMKR